MAILSDYNAISIASCIIAATREKAKLDESLITHIVINKFREINMKLTGEFGDHIILCDRRSWRKDAFKHYKAGRAEGRAAGVADWDLIFKILRVVQEAFVESFPFYVISQEGCEADDLIAAFAKLIDEPVCIVSKDGDFNQLHSDRVHQWEFSKKRFIKDPNPALNRLEKIIKGDKGDGVPNILSDDDTYVTEGKRSATMTQGRLLTMLEYAQTEFKDAPKDLKRNWDRNKLLIDLTDPVESALKAFDIYKDQKENKKIVKKDTVDFLIKNKMIVLMSKVNDFFPRTGERTKTFTKTPTLNLDTKQDLSSFL